MTEISIKIRTGSTGLSSKVIGKVASPRRLHIRKMIGIFIPNQ